MQVVAGLFFMLVDLFMIVFGFILALIGAGLIGNGGGQGNIKVVVEKVGEITGINGYALIFVAGFVLIALAVTLALKAFQLARCKERAQIRELQAQNADSDVAVMAELSRDTKRKLIISCFSPFGP